LLVIKKGLHPAAPLPRVKSLLALIYRHAAALTEHLACTGLQEQVGNPSADPGQAAGGDQRFSVKSMLSMAAGCHSL